MTGCTGGGGHPCSLASISWVTSENEKLKDKTIKMSHTSPRLVAFPRRGCLHPGKNSCVHRSIHTGSPAEPSRRGARKCRTRICLDGACTDCSAAVAATVPKLLCSICTCHTLDLPRRCIELAEGFRQGGRTQLQTAILFVAWARARPRFLGLLKTVANLPLLLPDDTRFGTHLLTLERLIRLKVSGQVLCSEGFTTYVTKLKRKPARDTANEWSEKLLANNFWKRGAAGHRCGEGQRCAFSLNCGEGWGNHKHEWEGVVLPKGVTVISLMHSPYGSRTHRHTEKSQSLKIWQVACVLSSLAELMPVPLFLHSVRDSAN